MSGKPIVRAALGAVIAASAIEAAPPLTVPGDATPAAVAALGSLERVDAFGVSADGAVALAALPSEGPARRSVLWIGHADGKAATLELPGSVPALVVASAGELAFLIVRETDKKGVVRRVSLVRVDPASPRATAQAALPATARGLAFGPGEASLLVAAKDEIRTFLLPDLTSGPLYRVPGANNAIAPLAGTTRLLLAQGARLAVVDLASPQERDGLPVAGAVDAAGLVRMLASSPEEPVGVALLEDGGVVLVETEPLRLMPRAPALAIAWPGVQAAPPAAVPAVPPVPEPVERPPSVPPPFPSPEPRPFPQPERERPSTLTPPPPPAPEPDVLPAPSPAAPPSATAEEPGTVSGAVLGAARASVREVVLLGPDNILKEAARVEPDEAGRYTVPGLKTGSYRIVVAGESGRVLVCVPPYVTVKVSSGAALEAPALDVLRVH